MKRTPLLLIGLLIGVTLLVVALSLRPPELIDPISRSPAPAWTPGPQPTAGWWMEHDLTPAPFELPKPARAATATTQD